MGLMGFFYSTSRETVFNSGSTHGLTLPEVFSRSSFLVILLTSHSPIAGFKKVADAMLAYGIT